MKLTNWGFATLFMLHICGCAVVPKQPGQISALVPVDKNVGATPKISGSYANVGDAFTVKGENLGRVLLSRLLLIEPPPATCWCVGISNKTRVLYGINPSYTGANSVMVAEPDVIEMQFFREGQSVAMRRYSKYTWSRATGGHGIFANWDSNKYGQPYYPVKGFLDIGTREEHGGAAGIGGYAEGEDCLLRKAVDGCLIVLHREQHFGIFVMVPFGGTEDIWCRFPPIEDRNQAQQTASKPQIN